MNDILQLKLKDDRNEKMYRFVVDVDTELEDDTIKVSSKIEHLFTDKSMIIRYPLFMDETIKVSDIHISTHDEEHLDLMYMALNVAKKLGVEYCLDAVLLFTPPTDNVKEV